MSKVVATITMSLDGFTTGPNDGPGKGLGEGGERLHYWVFGGPWSYEDPHGDGPTGADAKFYDGLVARIGATIGGSGTYDAAEAWGGSNPFPVPFFIIGHADPGASPSSGFTFVDGFDDALEQARAAAGGRDVSIMGGASTIREALRARAVDELVLSIAPVVLGAGKPLFDASLTSLRLTPLDVVQSPFATHVTYRVER
jgi:dihydrofolate reductase